MLMYREKVKTAHPIALGFSHVDMLLTLVIEEDSLDVLITPPHHVTCIGTMMSALR